MEINTLESVMEKVGFGRYQKCIYLLICLTSITCGVQTLLCVYILAKPNVRCRLPPGIWTNDTYEIQNDDHRRLINLWIPQTKQKNESSYDECHLNDFLTNKTKSSCLHGWVYDTSEFEETFISEFNLVCQEGIGNHLKTILIQSYLFGLLVGSYISGKLSDSFGRKPTFMSAITLQLVVGLSTAFVNNPFILGALRFLTGIAVTGIFPIGLVISMELVNSDNRANIGVITEYFFALGVCTIAGMAYFIRNWRYLVITATLPSVVFLTYFWLLPESPRWLLVTGSTKKARNTLLKAAKINNLTISIEDEDLKKVYRDVFEDFNNSRSAPLMKLIRHPECILKAFYASFQWFVIAMIYYGISFYSDELYGNIYLISFLLGLVEIPAYFLAHIFLNRMGRRRLHIISMVGIAITCFVTVLSQLILSSFENAIITCMVLFSKLFSSSAFAVIYIWTLELYPTNIRSQGLGIAQMFSCVGSFLGPVLFSLKDIFKGKLGEGLPILAYGCFAFVAALLSLLLSETMNEPLHQTLDDLNIQKTSLIETPNVTNCSVTDKKKISKEILSLAAV